MNAGTFFNKIHVRKVLRFVSTYNRRKPFDFNFVDEMDSYSSNVMQLKFPEIHKSKFMLSVAKIATIRKGSSYIDLFRHKKLAKITSILMISWFLRYVTYYGI